MKDKLTSLDIKYLLSELSFIVNSRLDKITNNTDWLLEFYVTSKGKKFLRISLGKYICLVTNKDISNANNFCLYLRKYLNNSRLKEISQINSERIIKLEFDAKGICYILIFEMLSKGNIILCDNNYTISRALENQSFKDRQIITEIKYDYPRSRYNIFSKDWKAFHKVIKESTRDSIVKALAIDIGLGGVYAEEVCLLSSIDKNQINLSDSEIKKLFESLNNLLNQKIKPLIVYDSSKNQIDVIPFRLKLYEQNDKQEFNSFNEAINHYFSQTIAKKPSKYEKEINKLRKIIEQESNKILELEEQELVERSRAEAIYNNYQLINEILTEIKKARQKYSWKEIKEKLKGHKIIKDVNEREGKVEIEL